MSEAQKCTISKQQKVRAQAAQLRQRQALSFGAHIRMARESAGIPLNHFAEKIGLSAAYWSRIERDIEKPPRDEIIAKASEMLGLVSDDVFVAAGRLPPDIQADLRRAVRLFRIEVAKERGANVSH